MSKKNRQRQQTLWCLPYDSDSVFKPFLKIPFSTYLNNIISNQHFPAYQLALVKQIKDQHAWNQKCWRLIQFFQFLNDNFELSTFDDNVVDFIQDNNLRSTMGYFRLWIDTERLYLLNFLKLDSNQFQQDRIYMTLFRTLIFFNHLFSEYMYKDFRQNFLNPFIRETTAQLQKMGCISTNETNQLIERIITLLQNIKKRETVLIQPKYLFSLKKGAGIKVSKQGEVIKDVQNRLKNYDAYKKKTDQQIRLKMICKPGFIDELTNSIKNVYDPIHKISTQFQGQYYGSPEQKQRKRQQSISEQINNYKKAVMHPSPTHCSVYERINENNHNPYELKNYQIYGQSVKIDMEKKKIYEKVKQTEVVSVEDYDRSKFYYDDNFIKEIEKADKTMGKVTYKDINTFIKDTDKDDKTKGKVTYKDKNTTNQSVSKKAPEFKAQDQNTRVFNLKWHHDQTRRKTIMDDSPYAKDYDNNLLFKSPFQQQMLQNKRNNLDKLKDNLGVKTYTIALLNQMSDQIHPDHMTSSFGSNLFVKKTPQLLDIKNFKLLDQNKFDFMRKVVGYMTAQKKIKNIISQKNVPDEYPRYYSDVKQDSYNPELQYQKYKYSMGRTTHRPQLYL